MAVILLTLSGGAAAGCRAPSRAAPAPEVVDEGYCWWAVLRSPLSPDSLAARFAAAFDSVGLAGIKLTHIADTSWAQAQPTVIGGAHASGTYMARVVAYRRGDSTHFRQYVSVTPPPGGWPQSDSTRARGENLGFARQLGFCAEVARIAHPRAATPRTPDGEEQLNVWRQRP